MLIQDDRLLELRLLNRIRSQRSVRVADDITLHPSEILFYDTVPVASFLKILETRGSVVCACKPLAIC